ncbi:MULTISPECIES: XRE family transcriptional regulator [Bacillus]|uniref:XRE family transcriptional regulator n=1 Tax=Bacillus TaxID=1386 RepID=UPI001ED8F6B9|nr:XRE family transcriptional regulator [Bacillus amyloliquefaciens]MEC2252196.1 XRE family transcriptional regulator [Bacillus amyloliquefaciens]MED0832562.1 XRE family transcriptional regulator [Bacillus amyloliquefaciens]MED1581765.1 XRE family transcriptional regulator [Bacillus amyloliquefaciens]MED4497647.1 XRE family transcriptional regulator [Bacillus amyloliquefaciens]MED4527256.1 XRE family transcriptional regulator [Bacillus amyloliquefaciens]
MVPFYLERIDGFMVSNKDDIIEMNIEDIMEVPEEYYSISVPKLKIINAIKDGLDKNKLSVRKLAEKVNLKHPQIIRVTNGKNYNVDTLLKILDGLDLEIEIKPKNK